MKSTIQWLQEIDHNFPVEKIKINGYPAWQLLRHDYGLAYYEQNELSNSTQTPGAKKRNDSLLTGLKNAWILFTNAFWQIKNMNRPFKYLLFTDVLEYRFIQGKYSDKIAHHLIKILGNDLLIILNSISERHREIHQYDHPFYLSELIFRLRGKLRAILYRNIKLENEDVLKEIEDKACLSIPYKGRVRDFLAYTDIMSHYFTKMKPELVFINCYYGSLHQAMIYAAHLQGIRVIELQHGMINPSTFAYNIDKNIGRESFPDYIFVFGEYVRRHLPNNFIDRACIFEIGNFYMEYIEDEAKHNHSLKSYMSDLRKHYKSVVCVTSQSTIEVELIDFLKKAAAICTEHLFIFIPRTFIRNYEEYYEFPANMIVNPAFDFYQYASHCDFHATVYSTCALEAPFFGTPNIMIDIAGMSKQHFADILNDSEVTRYVEKPFEMAQILDSWHPLPRSRVKQKVSFLFKSNNRDNVFNALNHIRMVA
jgi:hypothetical protein